MQDYYIYLITNKNNSVIYTGVTNDLVRRIYEHKNKLIKGFTTKYNVEKLIYYEECNDPYIAIEREKFIKGKKRDYKINLINSMNPKWTDLYDSLLGDSSPD